MPNNRIHSLVVLLVAGHFLLACEPDRLGYVEQAAQQVCAEARSCDKLGQGGSYASYDECVIEESSRFNNWWPESKCGDGRIDATAFDRCIDRAKLVACDGGLVDQISYWEHCHADRVCPAD